jgi:hypothetical protein
MVIRTDTGVGLGGADVLEGRPEGTARPHGVATVVLTIATTLVALAAAVHIGSASPATHQSVEPAISFVSTPAQTETGERHAVPPAEKLCVDAHHRALVANAKRRGRSVNLGQGRRWCGRDWTAEPQNGSGRPDGVRRSGSRRTVLLVDWRT